MKNIRIFIWKLPVFGVKFSIYLNRRVFLIICVLLYDLWLQSYFFSIPFDALFFCLFCSVQLYDNLTLRRKSWSFG